MKSLYRFSQVLEQQILKYRPAYVHTRQDDYQLNLEFPKPHEEVEDITNVFDTYELNLQPSMTLSDLSQYMSEKVPNIQNISFYSIQKTPMASITTLEDAFQEPCYMMTDSGQVFYIRRFQGYDQDQYSQIKEYFNKMSVPLLERNIIQSYLVRMDNLLEINHKSTFFKNNSDFKLIDQQSLVRVILDSFLDMKNTQSDHEQDMYDQYYQLKLQNEALKEKRRQIIEIAKKQAKLQMFGGLMVLCGHFCFMGAGIYVYYDWDVMEPIGYFLNTGGMIYLSYQYFKLQGEWSHSKFSNYLIMKNFSKLARKYDFDQEKFDEIEKQIQQIQDRIKTNIVTKL